MELLHGSPADMSGRSDREIRTYQFLDRLGIEFDRTDHPDQPATSMDVCANVDAILNVHICKNLFLCNRQKTNFYLLVMPGDKPFKTKELSKQMGISRLSFADEEYMERFLDIHPGSVSVLGLMNDRDHRVTLAIDEDEEDGGHVAFYVMDQLGTGEIDEAGVRLVPTVHCNRCGRRMNAFARTDLGHVEYSCCCGMKYAQETGWISGCEDEEEIV